MKPTEHDAESVASYTEATHVVDGPAPADADLISTTSATFSYGPVRRFRPEGVTVLYHWRTQLGHSGWVIGNIHISGPWVADDGSAGESGSGFLLYGMGTAPQWAKDFATTHFPSGIRLDFDGVDERPNIEDTVEILVGCDQGLNAVVEEIYQNQGIVMFSLRLDGKRIPYRRSEVRLVHRGGQERG